MDTQQSTLFAIHKVQYSNGIVFYWTNWVNRRIPLIKYGDIFVPVGEHQTQILLAIKLIAIAELRMNGEHPVAYENTNSVQGRVMLQTFSCQNELHWPTIVFGEKSISFKFYRDLASDELKNMMIEH